ncbi:hypothetical protein FRC04_005095 [Tulasnella sp. 424]|nr:hypothetical protein FRC04_005095 [Tulasnella sp. 424]
MSKSQFYLQQCSDAASKSSMCFHLGAILVKGGKIISTGYNHHRTHYDGSDSAHGQRKPVSMHAEMHAIYNATGMSPAFSRQVKAESRRVSPWRPPQYQSSPSPLGPASGSGSQSDAAWVDEEEDYWEPQQDVQPPPATRQPQQQRRPTAPTPQRPAKGPPIFKGTEGRRQEELRAVRTQELARQQSTKFVLAQHQQQGDQEPASTEQQRQWEWEWVGQSEPWKVEPSAPVAAPA